MDSSHQTSSSSGDFEIPEMPSYTRTLVKWGAVALGFILLLVLLSFLKSIYTNSLWYDSLGMQTVYLKILVTKIVVFLIGASVAGLLVGLALYVANRYSAGSPLATIPLQAVSAINKAMFWGSIVATVVLSIVLGSIMSSHWELILKFVNSVTFNEIDPVFGLDISFYMFSLPLYQFLQGWFLSVSILMLVSSLAIYFINFSVRGLKFEFTSGLTVQISIITAIILFIIGIGHWLDRWELVLSDQGKIFGAAYADIHARKPALMILTFIAGISGIVVLVSAYTKRLKLLVGGVALWAVMAIVLTLVWPRAMQQVTVSPNEFVKEGPYIERNISFTRQGFGLSGIEDVFFPVDPSGVTGELVSQNLKTVNNIRLWDPKPLSDVYRQIQLIRPYYDFKDADVDRYVVGGEYRQVLLSAREVAAEKLSEDAQTWVNERLVYTHGIGIAMSPVTDFTSEGRPEFFAKDIPTDGIIPITSGSGMDSDPLYVNNPRIYYGENSLNYVITNSNTAELDYQTEEGDLFRTYYEGDGGVRLSSIWRRIAYAWEFGDINILISGEITGDSLIQYRREIQERVATVAPFLLLDADPYIVAGSERLTWIQDAYTVSDRYPYSEPSIWEDEHRMNYIRNSVKVTIDAYDGALKFYVWDTSDPVILAYQKMFPKLFSNREDMPSHIKQHVRYPQDLFTLQASQYTRYHMMNPENFYFDEDLWDIPNEKFGQTDTLQPVTPYYVIMKLPGEQSEEFVQLLPYTPNQRQNLIGWIAARSDGDSYGKLISFNFPKDRQVDGPEQVEARIDNDQDISAWFTLRCAEGSTCIRGNLLVIPLGNSIVYAEPIYIQAEGVTFPELKKVILATGDKVVMEDSLEEALVSLTGTAVITASEPEKPASVVPRSGGQAVKDKINDLSETINKIQGDLIHLKEAMESLKELIGR